LTLELDGIQATGTLGVQGSSYAAANMTSATEIPAGSTVEVTFRSHWVGNASHPSQLTIIYELQTGGFVWLSPPGKLPGAEAAEPATSTHQPYPLVVTDFSGETTATWKFQVGANAGKASLPVTMYVLHGNNATRADGALGFSVVPASVATTGGSKIPLGLEVAVAAVVLAGNEIPMPNGRFAVADAGCGCRW